MGQSQVRRGRGRGKCDSARSIRRPWQGGRWRHPGVLLLPCHGRGSSGLVRAHPAAVIASMHRILGLSSSRCGWELDPGVVEHVLSLSSTYVVGQLQAPVLVQQPVLVALSVWLSSSSFSVPFSLILPASSFSRVASSSLSLSLSVRMPSIVPALWPAERRRFRPPVDA